MENEGRETAEDMVAQIARLQEQIDALVKTQATLVLLGPFDREPRENAGYLAEGTVRGYDRRIQVHESLAEPRRQYDPGAGYDADLEAWGREFDEKVDELTARQDAFLKYLELQASRS